MKAHLGEEGTEQFTIETRVDGKTIRVQPIHDPFVTSTTTTKISWLGCLKGLLYGGVTVKHQVLVRGSLAAQRAIMTLDPEELERESERIIEGTG
jgi:hypothetical protein